MEASYLLESPGSRLPEPGEEPWAVFSLLQAGRRNVETVGATSRLVVLGG